MGKEMPPSKGKDGGRQFGAGHQMEARLETNLLPCACAHRGQQGESIIREIKKINKGR